MGQLLDAFKDSREAARKEAELKRKIRIARWEREKEERMKKLEEKYK